MTSNAQLITEKKNFFFSVSTRAFVGSIFWPEAPPGGEIRICQKEGKQAKIRSSQIAFSSISDLFLLFLSIFGCFTYQFQAVEKFVRKFYQIFSVKTGKILYPEFCGGGKKIRTFGQNIDRCFSEKGR